MSIFFRRSAPERREVIPFGAHLSYGSSSYADIDLSSFETSLQSVAVRSTADLIASLASELPIDIYSGRGADRKERTMPSWLEDPAGDGYGLADWVYQVTMSWLMRGNLYGHKLDVAPQGYLRQVEVFHPERVRPWLNSEGVLQWYVSGETFPAARMLHRRVNPLPGVVVGLSPVAQHADSIGVTLTSARYGLQWFRDGAHPSAMLTNEEVELGPVNVKHAKERFMAALRGTREPLVLGKGWKYQTIQVTAEESQFLATQGFTEAQCARIFGAGFAEILGYETGGSLTYANRVDRSTDLLTFSMNRWLTRLERLLSEFLPKPQYVKINRDAMLQSTTLDRYRAHELALRNRWKVVNEVRATEDLAPVEWGDTPNTAGPSDPTQDNNPEPAPQAAPKPKSKGAAK
jgi:HK97 family phage portal protein